MNIPMMRLRFFAEWSLLMVLIPILLGLFLILSIVMTQLYTLLYPMAHPMGQAGMNYVQAQIPVGFALVILGLLGWAYIHSTKREVDTGWFD